MQHINVNRCYWLLTRHRNGATITQWMLLQWTLIRMTRVSFPHHTVFNKILLTAQCGNLPHKSDTVFSPGIFSLAWPKLRLLLIIVLKPQPKLYTVQMVQSDTTSALKMQSPFGYLITSCLGAVHWYLLLFTFHVHPHLTNINRSKMSPSIPLSLTSRENVG